MNRAGFLVRAAWPEDAADIAAMANALNVSEGRPGDVHTASAIRRDLLGPGREFTVLVAERDGELIGYALFHPTYNSDLGVRGVWMVDLFVEAAARGCHVGRALVRSVARWAVANGTPSVWWGVRAANARARRFYASLGAREDDSLEVRLDGAALSALVAGRSPGVAAAQPWQPRA